MLGVGPPQPKGLARLRKTRLPLGQRRQLPVPLRQLLQTLVPVEERQGKLLVIEWECKHERGVAKGGRVVATHTRKPKRLSGEVESGGEMCLG